MTPGTWTCGRRDSAWHDSARRESTRRDTARREMARRAGTRHLADPYVRLYAAMALLVAVALVATGCGAKGPSSDSKDRGTATGAAKTGPAAKKYACPMDPEVTSDQPGQRCPKCGMFLQLLKDGVATGAEPGGAAGAEETAETTEAVQKASAEEKTSGKPLFICPMHPTYVSDRPGDCPVCGMRLVPAEQVSPGQEGSGIPGMVAIRLTTEGIRLAGVQTVAAARGSVARTIRTVGIVAADESRVRRVHVKTEGYVERLYVNTPGQAVHKGDPLLAIYSPDLLAGQEEFLRAVEAARNLDAAGTRQDSVRTGTSVMDQGRRRDADLMVRAARERLQLLDVPGEAIVALEQTRQPTRTITLRAPASGVVTERMVYEGMKVMPGMELLTITDLSKAWIEGSFYESEAPFVAVGRTATLTLAYDPSVALQGTVEFVYPYLDPESRTLRARFSFPNAGGELKPGMYANVTMEVEGGDGLLVPDNAVMDTGERKIVFVSKGNGLFEPRSVETGLRGGGMVQVLAGVMAGEEVVVRANFLLDSESRIRSALSGNGSIPAAGHDGHGAPAPLPGGTVPPAGESGTGTGQDRSRTTTGVHQHGGM